ncbi:MAG: hypothetical protein J7M26_01340 [Armatimonadetes bacterium]|nr:hypothetical protein [Armatimonadota bacterium]
MDHNKRRSRGWQGGALALVAGLLLVAGCSGGGGAGKVANPQGDYLSHQATVAALCLRWLPVLFPDSIPRSNLGVCQATPPQQTVKPDGTITLTYQRSDCAQVTWTLTPDFLKGDGEIHYPDGGVETQHFETTIAPDGTATVQDERHFPDGAWCLSTVTLPPWGGGADPLLNAQQGQFHLPDGRRMDFQMEGYMKHMALAVDGHEGWTFALQAPAKPGEAKPDLSGQASGSLRGSPEALTFALEDSDRAGECWDTMRVNTPEGLSGLFQLDPFLRGKGTVRRKGQIVMTLSWDRGGRVKATYADGAGASNNPSAAARDFLVNQWIYKLGQFGPSPR